MVPNGVVACKVPHGHSELRSFSKQCQRLEGFRVASNRSQMPKITGGRPTIWSRSRPSQGAKFFRKDGGRWSAELSQVREHWYRESIVGERRAVKTTQVIRPSCGTLFVLRRCLFPATLSSRRTDLKAQILTAVEDLDLLPSR